MNKYRIYKEIEANSVAEALKLYFNDTSFPKIDVIDVVDVDIIDEEKDENLLKIGIFSVKGNDKVIEERNTLDILEQLDAIGIKTPIDYPSDTIFQIGTETDVPTAVITATNDVTLVQPVDNSCIFIYHRGDDTGVLINSHSQICSRQQFNKYPNVAEASRKNNASVIIIHQ